MRLARLATDHGPIWARPDDDGEAWHPVADPFTGSAPVRSDPIATADAQFLPPADPRVIIGMAHNGSPEDRARPPQGFHKSARTAVGQDAFVAPRHEHGTVIAEGELAIVIGREAHDLDPASALDVVLGYTVANDLTYLDQLAEDSYWTQAKNGDGFTPLGPWLETDLDPTDRRITLTIDGQEVASNSTASLARNAAEVLVYLSRYITLGAGDVVLLGCPQVAHPVEPGSSVEIGIDGIGALRTVIG